MNEWITTSTILSRLRDHEDQDVWRNFSDRFNRPIVAFARKMGLSEADAFDAAPETLLAFLKSYRDGAYDRDKGRLSKWLFGIAYRQAQSTRRSTGRRAGRMIPQAGHTTLHASLPDENSASATWDAEWEAAVLDACLKQVRSEVADNTFAAFDLVVRQGVAPDAAAEQLNMSRSAVYTAKHRVLARAREMA
ncbi:MAG: sigma-70 family RNA polymerase sigma factor, partial [Phycisphaerales bacterium]|nr:sigma-70 family RNA polymerase sigma factor [Phycisphaerales bacterium]